MVKRSLLLTVICLALPNIATADFVGFAGTVSQYNDGVTDWQVLELFATFDTVDTEVVLNILNANITTKDGLGFNHNDLVDAQGGTWKPGMSFEMATYDPKRDSYVDLSYGVGALAATNQTALDPSFDGGLGAAVPVNAGWYNGNPDNPRVVPASGLKIGQFVWKASRSDDAGSTGFFNFDARIGYKNAAGDTVFGADSYTWEAAAVIPEPSAFLLLSFISPGLIGMWLWKKRGV